MISLFDVNPLDLLSFFLSKSDVSVSSCVFSAASAVTCVVRAPPGGGAVAGAADALASGVARAAGDLPAARGARWLGGKESGSGGGEIFRNKPHS